MMKRPIQNHIQRLLNKLEHGCESAVLEFQKLPNIDDPPQKDSLLKLLVEICGKINNSEKKQKFVQYYFQPQNAEDSEKSFDLINGGRLLVNHSCGVFENANLCLHRLFEFPMIPGSALKGVARAYASEYWEDKEQFSRIFGGVEKRKSDASGNIIFLPANPADENWKVIVDVLTSHKDSDTENPNPVFFLAVERGAKFHFVVCKKNVCTPDADLIAAKEILIAALTNPGVGAKTAAGYGWFEKPKDPAVEVYKWEKLETHLQECLSLPKEIQKVYFNRMLEENARLIRRWQRKGNPQFADFQKLADMCGEELSL